jgi:hypothetical protein
LFLLVLPPDGTQLVALRNCIDVEWVKKMGRETYTCKSPTVRQVRSRDIATNDKCDPVHAFPEPLFQLGEQIVGKYYHFNE